MGASGVRTVLATIVATSGACVLPPASSLALCDPACAGGQVCDAGVCLTLCIRDGECGRCEQCQDGACVAILGCEGGNGGGAGNGGGGNGGAAGNGGGGSGGTGGTIATGVPGQIITEGTGITEHQSARFILRGGLTPVSGTMRGSTLQVVPAVE